MSAPSRNDPCPCGSGKKYKQCCLRHEEALAAGKHSGMASIQKAFQSALALHQAGRLPQAEAIYRQILQVAPNHPDALHFLGAIAHHDGNNQAAVEFIRRAISVNPSPSMHYNLGNALQAQGKLDEAVEHYRKALALKPDYAEAHTNLGNALQAQGHLAAAAESYRRALALKPDLAVTHYNLGNVLQAQGKLGEAVGSYRKALALKPDYAEAHYNQGNALQAQGKIDEAVASYRKALAFRPDYAEAHNNLGNVLRKKGLLDEAIGHYRKALALKPDYADAHVSLAVVYIDSGQFEAARAELSKALELKPEHPVAWAMLASLRKMTEDDGDWLNTALRLVSKDSLSGKETFNLQFAIGKYYDDTQQYDLAFSAYSQANRLKRQMEGAFDRSGFSGLIDGLIATCTADSLNRQREGASLSRRPVLIVGMPRSGTSLVEQIIASHPDAFGAGELTFWGQQVTANMAAVLSGNYAPALIAKMAAGYEQCLQHYSADAARVVDKMPDNFLWLGLIHTVFPQAGIIHTQRNPVDTCLSIYFQNFVSGHSYGTDLEDLAFYYREYDRLMRHWRTVLPADRFLEVPYEALVDDQAGWSRRIIEFTGLGWDERCLDFHKTERKVGTASNWQARQKIYRTSKARWRHYEKHLGPLLGLLDL